QGCRASPLQRIPALAAAGQRSGSGSLPSARSTTASHNPLPDPRRSGGGASGPATCGTAARCLPVRGGRRSAAASPAPHRRETRCPKSRRPHLALPFAAWPIHGHENDFIAYPTLPAQPLRDVVFTLPVLEMNQGDALLGGPALQRFHPTLGDLAQQRGRG